MDLLIIGLCGQSVFLSVPHFHRPEETLHATALFAEPGGKGYNQAVAARRMGAKVAFSGAVGWDADGDACVDRLKREEIDSCIVRKPGQTAYAAILTDVAGENRVTVFSGTQMTAQDIIDLAPQFERAKMLLLTPEIPEDAFAQAILLAKENGVRIVINPAPFFPWVKKYLDSSWLLTPNRSEACAMFECTEDALMDQLSRCSYPRMVVTLGKDGALCLEDGTITPIPAPIVKAVDTTGAGDCLNGALCALLLSGTPLVQASKWAVRAASLSVEHAHVLDGMPNLEQVLSVQ